MKERTVTHVTMQSPQHAKRDMSHDIEELFPDTLTLNMRGTGKEPISLQVQRQKERTFTNVKVSEYLADNPEGRRLEVKKKQVFNIRSKTV